MLMRVRLKLTLHCSPDAAWRAIRSPEVFQAVSRPFTTFTSLEPDGYPQSWSEGEHPVEAKAFGVLPMGQQVIAISFREPTPGVRAVVDNGRGVSGGLAVVRNWHHTMAVSEAPGGKTLFRDRLEFDAGLLSPLMWVVYFAFWQWRALRLKQLARHWSKDTSANRR